MGEQEYRLGRRRGMGRGVIIGIIIAVVILVPLIWYLASPLFVTVEVDEPFPFEVPSAEALAEMSEEELNEMAQEFAASIPSAEEVAAMAEDEREELEAAVVQAAARVMPTREVEDPMPAEPTMLVQGEFTDADLFHQGAGLATIYALPGDEHLLRLDNFEVTNGPDLHVLLATNAAPSSSEDLGEYVDLGELKGNMGNQNYEIPADVDVEQYQSVVIYCMPFHVVFATAALN